MDDMNKTIRMAGDLIAENFDRFSEEIGNTALFTNEQVTLQRDETTGMATFHLKAQMMMEDFIDELTKYLAIEVLCATVDRTTRPSPTANPIRKRCTSS